MKTFYTESSLKFEFCETSFAVRKNQILKKKEYNKKFMKKIVYSIFLVCLFFLLNLTLYYYSDSYSFFLKKMKYWDDVILNDSKNITDEYFLTDFDNNNCECNCENQEQISPEITKPDIPKISENLTNTSAIISQEKPQKDYSKEINSVISKFREFYSLEEKTYDEYYKIFDITDEYPDIYSTFVWDNLEIYVFPEAKFQNVYDMFELLSWDNNIQKKFSVNKTNNFWKNSFFLNLNPWDDFARMIIDDWNILFWLKLKKSYYNDIKQILQNF